MADIELLDFESQRTDDAIAEVIDELIDDASAEGNEKGEPFEPR